MLDFDEQNRSAYEFVLDEGLFRWRIYLQQI